VNDKMNQDADCKGNLMLKPAKFEEQVDGAKMITDKERLL